MQRPAIGLSLLALFCLTVCGQRSTPSTNATAKSPAAAADSWQQNWRQYGVFISQELAKGVHPDSDEGKKLFYNKNVEWTGTLKNPFKGEDKEVIELTMEPIDFSVPVRFFPGGTTSEMVPFKTTRLGLYPAKDAIDAWKAVTVGTKVSFTANTGTMPIIFFAMQPQGQENRAAIILTVENGVPHAK